MSSQKPCFETLVTSISEMRLPGCADLIFVLSNQAPGRVELPLAQSVILGQLDLRFQPKLRLTVRSLDMDVHPRFLAGEEVEPEPSAPKHGWTHSRTQRHRFTLDKTLPFFRGLTPGVRPSPWLWY